MTLKGGGGLTLVIHILQPRMEDAGVGSLIYPAPLDGLPLQQRLEVAKVQPLHLGWSRVEERRGEEGEWKGGRRGRERREGEKGRR